MYDVLYDRKYHMKSYQMGQQHRTYQTERTRVSKRFFQGERTREEKRNQMTGIRFERGVRHSWPLFGVVPS